MFKTSSIRNHYLVATTLLFFLLLTGEIISQNKTGIISGEVRDAVTKQPLPIANILIDGTNQRSACDEDGYFVIKNVVPGRYSIKVSMIGYLSSVITELNISPNRNQSVNFERNSITMKMDEVKVTKNYFHQLKTRRIGHNI